ncbi:MAG: type II secretion system GspH family protein [Defluviitaleaceae bacterium]|nr:type II secretion system GspH family protein [Defluviitaleaceae bacterium]
MKPRGGFSYLEVIIAMAIFSVLLMAVLPLVIQSRRNMAYAREGYDAHLAAQNIMLAVRNAGGITAISGYAESYSVWIFGAGGTAESFVESLCAPALDVSLGGDLVFFGNMRTIVAVVWREMPNGEKHKAGRAVGFMP